LRDGLIKTIEYFDQLLSEWSARNDKRINR
jgi:hypothetical protein